MNKIVKNYSMFGIILIWLASIAVKLAGYTSLAIACSAGYFICYLLMVFLGKKAEEKEQMQWLVITTGYLLFWTAAFFCETTVKDHVFTICFGLVCLNITWVILLGRTADVVFRIPTLIKENIGVVIVMIAFVVLSWETLYEYPRWDSLVYYTFPYNDNDLMDATWRFDFLFSDIMKYNLIGHTSWGYTFIGMTGILLTGGNALGIHVINLLMVVITLGCFWGLLKMLFPKSNQIERTGMTMVFAFSPFVLGILGVVNLDMPMLCYLVILVYCYKKQYQSLMLVVSLMLAFAKEPGIIYYCLFVVGIWLIQFIKNKETNIVKKLFCTFKIEEYIKYCYIPVLWLTIFLLNSNSTWGSDSGESAFRWDSNGFNCFGWQINNVVEKSKQFLGLNFNWLLVLMILAGILSCIVRLVRRKKAEQVINGTDLLPFVVPFIGVLGFNYLYITVYHARYLVAGVAAVTLCAVVGIYAAFRNAKVRSVIYFVVAACMLVQSFYSLDPVTNQLFPRMNVGGTEIVSLKGNGAFAFNDSIVYNRQYSYWDKLNQIIFETIDYQESDVVILPEMYGGETRISLVGTYESFWNLQDHSFQSCYEEGKAVWVSIATAADKEALKAIEADGRKFLLFPSWYWDGTSGMEEFVSESEVVGKQEFSYRGWKAYLYEIK